MIIKSIVYLAIISHLIGANFLADKFDNALFKSEGGVKNSAIAGSSSLPLPFIAQKPTIDKFIARPNIYAKHYLLADMDSGTILLKSNIKDKVPIASTTKIMTALVVLDNYKLSDPVIISVAAAFQAGADSYLQIGEKITVSELLYCLLIKSGNDAAYALAEHANGLDDVGVDKFVSLMNKKAKTLGMKDTNYKDPAGLDANGYSSAYDLFLVTKSAMQNKLFRQIVATKEYSAKSLDGQIWHKLDNSNRLVGEYNYPGAIGVKTGYMPEAGHCLVTAVKRNGHTLIGVVLKTNADNASVSADESVKMFDWAFPNIKW